MLSLYLFLSRPCLSLCSTLNLLRDSPLVMDDINNFSIIFHLSANDSTSVPIFSLADMPSSSALMRDASFLFDPLFYHTRRVVAGDIMLFRQSVAHHGIKNMAKTPRYVLFDVLTDDVDLDQQEQQYYPWSYMLDSFGATAAKTVYSLLANCANMPMTRHDNAGKGRIRAAFDWARSMFVAMEVPDDEEEAAKIKANEKEKKRNISEERAAKKKKTK